MFIVDFYENIVEEDAAEEIVSRIISYLIINNLYFGILITTYEITGY